MKSAEKARNNGLYRHIRTSKEIIRNLLNDYYNSNKKSVCQVFCSSTFLVVFFRFLWYTYYEKKTDFEKGLLLYI